MICSSDRRKDVKPVEFLVMQLLQGGLPIERGFCHSKSDLTLPIAGQDAGLRLFRTKPVASELDQGIAKRKEMA